jgi:hypothetical protein
MGFEPLLQLPAAWSSVHDRIALHLFEGHLSVAEMERMHEVGARWNVRHPEKRVELAVIFSSAARMTQEERAGMARLMKLGEVYRAASATVVLAAGLRGAMHRSILTGLMMVAPPPHPSKVFSDVAEAITWLEPHLREIDTAAARGEELVRLVEAHISEFRVRPGVRHEE